MLRIHGIYDNNLTICSVITRDVVLTKKVWERSHKTAILKQLQTYFKAKHEKGVGTPFPLHYTPCYN